MARAKRPATKPRTLTEQLDHAADQVMRIRDDLGKDCEYIHSVLNKALKKIRNAEYAANDNRYNDALENEVYQLERLRNWKADDPMALPLFLQAEQYATAFRERCRLERLRLKLDLSVATNPNELPPEE